MRDDFTEILDFKVEEKKKVGRPKLADKKTKKNSLIIASVSFIFVILLLIFGYGTMFGFKNLNLNASASQNKIEEEVLIAEIKPLVKDITIKTGNTRKIYLTVLPASATNKLIDYMSSDDSIVTVDETGRIYGVRSGKATITASTTDGTDLSTEFNITVVKSADGICEFTNVVRTEDGLDYKAECSNAEVKEIQYKVDNENYSSLDTKKLSDSISFSKEQLNKKITLKIVYYPNNSKISKYKTKVVTPSKTTTKPKTGVCNLSIKEVNSNSAKYDITCTNASVTKIAYKIGNGSYVGIDESSIADTVLFEESEITRVIYFNIEYQIDGTTITKTVTKSSIIEKKANNN